MGKGFTVEPKKLVYGVEEMVHGYGNVILALVVGYVLRFWVIHTAQRSIFFKFDQRPFSATIYQKLQCEISFPDM